MIRKQLDRFKIVSGTVRTSLAFTRNTNMLDMKFTELVVRRDPNCEHGSHSAMPQHLDKGSYQTLR